MPQSAVFVLSSPLIEHSGELYLGDECYRQTMDQNRPRISDPIVVARVRSSPKVAGRTRLSQLGARLAMRLPEFGGRPLLPALAAWCKLCLSQRLAADLAAIA